MSAWGPDFPPDDFDDEDGPDAAQQAFAAYEDAWRERSRTGSDDPSLLVAALKARGVPKREYAEGVLLHRTLFESWERGRTPKRMRRAMLGHSIRSTLALPAELIDIFRDHTPEHMAIPKELARSSRYGDSEDTELELVPAGTFAARVPAWWKDCDDDGRTREIPIWLDPQSTPGRAYVMVGREIAGHTTIPLAADAILRTATKRRKRVVADGGVWVKKTKDGAYRVKGLSVALPDPDAF